MDIDKELIRVGTTAWSDVRRPENYTLEYIDYPVGRRVRYKPASQEVYEDLQCSRGLSITTTVLDDALKKLAEESQEIPGNYVSRIDELQRWHSSLNDVFSADHGFAEIGFRHPRFLEAMRERFKFVRGFDVVDINVMMAQQLGYDARKYDLSLPVQTIDIAGIRLLTSYHVLEHTTDPFAALKRLHSDADVGAYFHVEIPTEYDAPTLRMGHVFGFHPDDLPVLLEHAGWTVLGYENRASAQTCFACKR